MANVVARAVARRNFVNKFDQIHCNTCIIFPLILLLIAFREYVKILQIQLFLSGHHFEFYSLILKNMVQHKSPIYMYTV